MVSVYIYIWPKCPGFPCLSFHCWPFRCRPRSSTFLAYYYLYHPKRRLISRSKSLKAAATRGKYVVLSNMLTSGCLFVDQSNHWLDQFPASCAMQGISRTGSWLGPGMLITYSGWHCVGEYSALSSILLFFKILRPPSTLRRKFKSLADSCPQWSDCRRVFL